jgi:hypothetical protein
MSTTMNSQKNNEKINNVFDNNNKDFNYKNFNNSIHLRDQLNKFLSESLNQGKKDNTNIPSDISSLINNRQIEKIQSLENQIADEEKLILVLEKAKDQKLIKVIQN